MPPDDASLVTWASRALRGLVEVSVRGIVREFLLVVGLLSTAVPTTAIAEIPVTARGVRSGQLSALVQQFWNAELERQPLARLQAGLQVEGIPDGSPHAIAADIALARRLLADLAAIPESSLVGEDVITARVLRWQLNQRAAAADEYWYEFPITSYTTFDLQFAFQALAQNPLVSEVDRTNYLGILNTAAARLDATIRRIEAQAARGIRLPRPALPATRTLFENFRSAASRWPTAAESRLPRLSARQRDQFLGEVRKRVARVDVALGDVLAVLGPQYERAAPEKVGLSQYPGGETYYRMLVRRQTSLDTTPEEVTEYGRRRIAEINAEIEDIAVQLGIAGGRAGIRDYLRGERSLIAETHEDVAARYRKYMGAIAPRIASYFARTPRAPYGVRRLDPKVEGSMTFGYYQPPTSLNPIGEYHYNGSALEQRSLAFSGAIIFHELVPGHHFHMALQAENDSLPDFRRYQLGLNAFNEGWAEYGAGLAEEMGLLSDPVDRLGRLMLDAFLTTRLIVDPGMNVFDWTLEHARAFMFENTYQSVKEIDSEILRYATAIPAQALGYKMGHRALLEMRATAQARCGASFDIRAFHSAALDHGALPLEIVRDQVDRLCR